MAKKLVFAIGFELPDVEGFECLPMTSDRSFLDADVIAVELNLRDFSTDGYYDGQPQLTKSASFSLRELKQHWPNKIMEAFKSGKTIVFFLTSKEDKFYYTGNRTISGTGRNQSITNHVSPVSNYEFLPFSLSKPTYARGRSMTLEGKDDIISDFWHTFTDRLEYNCCYEVQKAKPLARTKSGNFVVASVIQEFGNIIYLPEINYGDVEELKKDSDGKYILDEDGDHVYSDEIISLSCSIRDCLLQIDRRLNSDREETAPPQWIESAEYRLSAESLLEAELLTLGAKIEELEAERARKRTDLKMQGTLRNLLFEKGKPLEDAVREALALLGFSVENFRQGDSEFDAVFYDETNRFLGEIEGKDNKAINVDKISQLQRNITEDYARDDVVKMAAGVLFGNGYRLKNLAERPNQFTEKIYNVSKISQISLVITSDLFEISKYLKENSDPDFAKLCREAISAGAGKLVVFPKAPFEQTETNRDEQ